MQRGVVATTTHLIAALYADLRGWTTRGRQPPPAPAQRQLTVQPAMTRDVHREMAKGDVLHPRSNPAYPHVALTHVPGHIQLEGDSDQASGVWVWVDGQGCHPGMEVHAHHTNEWWQRAGQTPTCSHYQQDNDDDASQHQ